MSDDAVVVPRRRRGRIGPTIGASALRAVVLILALGLPIAAAPPAADAAADAGQTPFRVTSDPARPGQTTTAGAITTVRGSGVAGTYGGDGRLAGYTIDGTQDIVTNGATGGADVVGRFTATSPDGSSSIVVRYVGTVDFQARHATGSFVAAGGTGALDGYGAGGTIEGTVVPPATLVGVDVGLC